ncbi:MAG: hypothetical protein ACYC05_03710 [Sulfuricella sp.]
MVFDSLTQALEAWFDKPLCNLPADVRERIKQDFSPMPWDDLSAEGRRSVALQLDYQHDPSTEQDRKFWWDFFERTERIKNEIKTWETITAPTAIDLEKKETRLAELRRELAAMIIKQRNARGDYLDSRGKRPGTSPTRCKADYMPYPKALKLLSDRLRATPEEIAAWVWMGPNDGGLAAYLNANELNPPPRFYFDYYMGTDYLSPMMACWFLADDIANFEPGDRYITGKTLIERWSEQADIQLEAFIRAKIGESRLMDLHPTMGATQWSEGDSFPAKETALFVLAHVKSIEVEDFNESVTKCRTKPSGHLNHDPEMQARANQIAAEQKAVTGRPITRNKAAQILAKELETDEGTVLRRIRKQWK